MNNILEMLVELSQATSVKKLPENIQFEIKNGDLYITMTPKGLISNMQDDCAAFEGWAILIKYWLSQYINLVYVIFSPISRDDYSKAEYMHYQRFIYRLHIFVNTYKWARYISNYSLEGYSTKGFVLNTPGSDSDVKVASHKEAQFERALVDIKPPFLCINDHQLPVGVFDTKVESSKQIMNSGAIDLWGIDGNVLNIYELKIASNKKVGIITELFFYVNILNDLMKHRINYEKDREYDDIRSFSLLYDAYQKRKISNVKGVFLSPSLHPLFFGGYKRKELEKASIIIKLLDFINESERLKAENIRFTYQYQQEL